MSEIIVTNRDGEERSVEFTPGLTLMQTIVEAGIDELLAICGGVCSCATCHVYIEAAGMARLPAGSEDESDLLSGSEHRNEYSRLSCQIRLTDDYDQLRVTVAPEDE